MLLTSREFLASGTGVAALVLLSLGAVFLVIVVPMAAFGVPSQVVLPAAGVCLAPLIVGLLLAARRAAVVRRRERLRRAGTASSGTISDVRQSPWVRVNRRHPWKVRYRYEAEEAAYEATEVFWDLPAGYVIGASVGVVYDASDPSRSMLRRALLRWNDLVELLVLAGTPCVKGKP